MLLAKGKCTSDDENTTCRSCFCVCMCNLTDFFPSGLFMMIEVANRRELTSAVQLVQKVVQHVVFTPG